MTTPVLGADELVSAQNIPESTVNGQIRRVEQGALRFSVKDRTNTPPGSPADGDAYIVTATATGAWTGWENSVAYRQSTSWLRILPKEGMKAWVQDEDVDYVYTSSWAVVPGSASEASAVEIWTGTETAKYVSPDKLSDAAVPTALTSSATITPDFNAGLNFSLTLGHNATLANPTNAQVGDSGVITITQDGTGSRTLAFGTNWKFPSGAPTLSTAAGTIDCLVYYVSAAGVILCNLTKAYSS